METDPLQPPLPFCQVGHHQQFSTHCARSFPPTSLIPPSSMSHIYYSIIMRCLPHHLTSIFLPLASRLSGTSPLLISQSPRISAAVSAVVLIYHPYHLSYLLNLYLSTWVSPEILIYRCIHHPASLLGKSLQQHMQESPLNSGWDFYVTSGKRQFFISMRKILHTQR